MAQFLLLWLGIVSIWYVQDDKCLYRLGACAAGLLAQPFWAYESYIADQWGVFLLCIPMCISWTRGLVKNWREL